MTGNQLESLHSLSKVIEMTLTTIVRFLSVISVVEKVLERVIYDQVYANLEEHNIICKHQPGFRAAHSTVTALFEATDI